MVVMLVVLVLSAIALPQVQAALNSYRLNAAVSASTWAIQTTRYQAISNVGTPVPIANQLITFSTSTTLQFSPNGSVSPILGAMTYSISSIQGGTKNVTVSNYGSITIQ